jgi:hypothetical protein
MKVKLGYPDKIVEIDDDTVYVFDGKLYSAPLEELVKYYLTGFGVLPRPVKAVTEDVVRVLLRTGEFEGFEARVRSYGESLSE